MAPPGTGTFEIVRADPEPPAPSEISANGASDGHSIVIGAGPAGLTAAYTFAKYGVAATVLEAEEQVGGLARRVERDGYGSTLAAIASSPRHSEVDGALARNPAATSSCSARGCRASTGTASSSTTRYAAPT